MNWMLVIGTVVAFHSFADAQDIIPLNNDYPFKDGIYMSFEEFKGDNPTYGVGEFRIDDVDSSDYDLTKVRKIKVLNKKGKRKNLSISKIWGLSYEGIPYIYYRGLGSVNNPLSNYDKLTRIDVIGSICMFRLEHQNNSYNTNTFTNKMIHDKQVFVLDMLMDMSSGKVHPFDYYSVKHYIDNDPDLLYELQVHLQEINLYDIVFAFNNRHLVYPSPVSYISD
ncbi:MAG: hypothetical protein GY751_17950 [Bacteroidetes bacterium]|nr:hypothetical protein [Bacteroidota bacterium]